MQEHHWLSICVVQVQEAVVGFIFKNYVTSYKYFTVSLSWDLSFELVACLSVKLSVSLCAPFIVIKGLMFCAFRGKESGSNPLPQVEGLPLRDYSVRIAY
jgi:hypothetical protein